MIKRFILALCLLAGGIAYGQEKATDPTPTKLTLNEAVEKHGYPVMKNSGNPSKDYQEYAAAKTEWKNNNPELYKSMFPRKRKQIQTAPVGTMTRREAQKLRSVK